MTLDANKALVRRVFEEVIPSGDATAMRDLVAPDFLDHDPLPGQAGRRARRRIRGDHEARRAPGPPVHDR